MSHFGRFGPPDIRDTFSLLVLNITFRTSADDLFPLFDRYGKVVDIFIPRDKRTGESRGFAFVRYKYADEAQKAIDRLDAGRITVENSRRTRSRSFSPPLSRRRYDDDYRDKYYRWSDDYYRDRDYRSDHYRDRDYRRPRSRSRDRYEGDRYYEKSKSYHRYSSSCSRSRSRSRSRMNDKEKRRSRSRSLESPLPARSASPLPRNASQSPAARSPGTASRSPEVQSRSADSRSRSPEDPSPHENYHDHSTRSPRRDTDSRSRSQDTF